MPWINTNSQYLVSLPDEDQHKANAEHKEKHSKVIDNLFPQVSPFIQEQADGHQI